MWFARFAAVSPLFCLLKSLNLIRGGMGGITGPGPLFTVPAPGGGIPGTDGNPPGGIFALLLFIAGAIGTG